MNRAVFLSLLLSLSLGSAALAQGQRSNVLDPWNNFGQPSAAVAQRIAALLPVPSRLPEWVFHEVLNPWGHTPSTTDRRFRSEERVLTARARALAPDLVQCFPAHTENIRHFSRMQMGPESTLQRIATPIHRCLAPLVKDMGKDIQLSTTDYTLVLRLDQGGLRHVFMVSTARLP